MPGSSTWPQSCATIQRRISTAPVSGSTSSTTAWVPLAKLDCDTSKTCVSSRPAVSPGTRPACAAAATSTQPTARLGSPRTENRPLVEHDVGGRRLQQVRGDRAAPCRSTAREASSAALPPIAAVRLPYVPPPCATSAVSPVSTSIASGSTPSTPADEPREHRDVPLALRRGAADDGDARRRRPTRTTALS